MPNLNTLLDRCVLLVYEFFDRFFLNGYVARLQDADDLAWFLTKIRGHNIPRYEVLGEMSRRFVAAVEKLAADQQIPLIEFERGQRKEDLAAPLFERARLADREGLVLIGWAQERLNVFSPPNKRDRQVGKFAPKRHPARPKTFYFYIWDRDWGPTNIRICTYAPFADMEGPCQGVAPGTKGWGRRSDPLGNLPHRGGAGAIGPPRTSNRDGCRGHPEPASPPGTGVAGTSDGNVCSAGFASLAGEAVQIAAEARRLTTMNHSDMRGSPGGAEPHGSDPSPSGLSQ